MGFCANRARGRFAVEKRESKPRRSRFIEAQRISHTMPGMASRSPSAPGEQKEPRWPAVLAVLGIGGLYFALPASLAVGPRWLLLSIVVALAIPGIITHRHGYDRTNRILGHVLSGVITLFKIGRAS